MSQYQNLLSLRASPNTGYRNNRHKVVGMCPESLRASPNTGYRNLRNLLALGLCNELLERVQIRAIETFIVALRADTDFS